MSNQITDMLGTPLEIGQYVAYAATNMRTGIEILRIIRIEHEERIQCMCVERSYGYCANTRPAYYKRIPYQGIALKDYKEK